MPIRQQLTVRHKNQDIKIKGQSKFFNSIQMSIQVNLYIASFIKNSSEYSEQGLTLNKLLSTSNSLDDYDFKIHLDMPNHTDSLTWDKDVINCYTFRITIK